MKKIVLVFIATLMFSTGPLWAQDFLKGFDAFRAGDYATALKEWEPLAEQGDASVQYYLGWMYEFGQGVPQDYQAAVKWYRLAAEQGGPEAQFNLAQMYRQGQGCSTGL